MKLETFYYTRSGGWSVPSFPSLDSSQTLVITFGAPEFYDDAGSIDELAKAYPTSHVIGCSTAGEIFDSVVRDNSLSVAVLQFERTTIRTQHAQCDNADHSYNTGEALAKALMSEDLRAVLVLSDGQFVNGSELVNGINGSLPQSVVVTGGLAGDGPRFGRTWVIQDGAPRSGTISAVGLYGKAVRVGHGSRGGWDPFGPERVVTKSHHNVLYELDGKPALELYKRYLGAEATGLPASALLFPLMLRVNIDDQEPVARTILSIDETAQSMTFAGDMPIGYLTKFMRANFDRLIGASLHAAQLASADMPTSPLLCVAISCVGRRLVLGERTEEELEASLDAFPSGTRQIGFYSYGEISPYAEGYCSLHNQTMTITTITEV